MATDNLDVFSYYSSLSPLCKKLCNAAKLGEQWFDDDNEPGSNQQQSMLSMLKVKCGDKIQVDFDNDDGWTWSDEHSGPFSWMTRSQQDLSIWDDVEDNNVGANRSSRVEPFAKHRLSEQFSVPFGGDDQVGEISEIQAAFQKFGLHHLSVDTPETSTNSPESMSPAGEHITFPDESDVSSMSDSPVHSTNKSYKNSSQIIPEEEKLIAEVHSPQGHISPVFEYDPLDSFIEQQQQQQQQHQDVADDKDSIIIDITTSQTKTSLHSEQRSTYETATADSGDELQLEGVTLEESCYDNPISVNDSCDEEKQFDVNISKMTDSTSNLPATGFDFLDNW